MVNVPMCRQGTHLQQVEDWWRIHASVNRAIIGSGNGLSPVQYQNVA